MPSGRAFPLSLTLYGPLLTDLRSWKAPSSANFARFTTTLTVSASAQEKSVGASHAQFAHQAKRLVICDRGSVTPVHVLGPQRSEA